MARFKFLDSFVFRLALSYMTLVVGAISIAFAFSYLAADRLLDANMRATIQLESERLATRHRLEGVDSLFNLLRARTETSEDAIYLLYRPAGEADPEPEFLVGSVALASVEPDEDGWIQTVIPADPQSPIVAAQRQRSVLAYYQQVAPGIAIVVGRDLASQGRVKEALFQMMMSGLGITTALGLAGGAMAAQRMVRRIERARRAAEDIMTGDLKRRLPLTGHADELERLTVTLNQMLDRIERLVAAMREVTDDVAHDLRTPLTRLRSRAERALSAPEATNADLRAALEECLGEADRLLAVFRAILSIARLKTQAGANAEHPEIDLSRAVEDAAELYEPVLEEAGFALRLEIEPGLRIRGERTLIGQALANLIENAMHYGLPPEGSGRRPEVALSLRARGERADLAVSDRGAGVPEDKREAVFSRFQRLDPSRAADGVGLGLAFVRAVAEAHGGSARIEDAAPGARVKLSLPRLASPPS